MKAWNSLMKDINDHPSIYVLFPPHVITYWGKRESLCDQDRDIWAFTRQPQPVPYLLC